MPEATLYAVLMVDPAADADVIAKLEDVAPDGTAKSYQMLGGLRASVRKLGKAPYDNRG